MTLVKHSSKLPKQYVRSQLTNSECSYAVSELQKDVEKELLNYPEDQRAQLREATKFGVFVVHNKKKPKLAQLEESIPYASFYRACFCRHSSAGCRYFSGADVDDVW